MVITADLDPANFGSIPNMSFKKKRWSHRPSPFFLFFKLLA